MPFLKKCFPNRTTYKILLDSEALLHAPVAKRKMEEKGVSVLPNWPKYSPDLNPQENVWAWAEERLRDLEKGGVTFETFQCRVLDACKQYPHASKLIGGMAKRIKLLLEKGGANIGK